jgi:hypothetical protein
MMPPEMCALRLEPRQTVFRAFPAPWAVTSRASRRPFSVHIVPRWRPQRRRSRCLDALGHAALLALLFAGLLHRPLGTPATVVGSTAPALWFSLAERPQVALEPFGLWWGIMGSPTVVFADPTVDLAPEEAVATEVEYHEAPAAPGKVAVPWRTQLDGSRFSGSNCGPASLGMILDAFKISKSTDELRYRSHTYQGTWGSYTGTALQHLARVAEDFGVPTRGLYDGARFRSWTVAELREEVAQGHPVMVLTKYRLLPGHEGSRAGDDHYIVLWDLDGEAFVYNDPAFTRGRDGYARRIAPAALERAMRAAIIPGQAVAFLPPKP